MKKILLSLLVLTNIYFAQSAGNTGLSFLKLGFGARNLAMGDIGAAASDNATSINYNPARLANMEGAELLFMHNEWVQDVRNEYLGASFKLFNIPLGVGVNSVSVSDIPVRLKPGESSSSFTASYFATSLSTGFNVVQNVSFGASIKYIYESILTDKASGLGFDLGLNYESPVKGLSFVTVVRNLGSMDALRVEETELPGEFRIGALYSYYLSSIKSTLTVGSEYMKYFDVDDTHINLGGEIFYDDLFALRVGYQSGWESRSFTGGVGLKWGIINFDYAFVPLSNDLGTGHVVSLKFSF